MLPLAQTRVGALRQSLLALGLKPKRCLKKQELYDMLKTALESADSVISSFSSSVHGVDPSYGPPKGRTAENTKPPFDAERHQAAIRIQAVWRSWSTRLHLQLRGAAAFRKDLCSNDVDPITIEPLDEIPLRDFFSFCNPEGIHFGFRVDSAYQCLEKCSSENPFTRQAFDKDDIRRFLLCRDFALGLLTLSWTRKQDFALADCDTRRMASRIFQLFHSLTGFRLRPSWFLRLTIQELAQVISTLEVKFRENRDPELSYEMARLAFDFGLGGDRDNRHAVYYERNWEGLCLEKQQKTVLRLFNAFVGSTERATQRYLLILHIISSVATCSEEAARAMPRIAPKPGQNYRNMRIIDVPPDDRTYE